MAGLQAEAPANEVAPAAGSDVENADPAEEGSLRKMFVQGAHQIATHRTDNLFQSLEQRKLTDEEQKIIEQRVALQRKMFEEYERRERVRKVAELREVCPDLSEEEAEKALELCDGREDDAAAQLVSDAAFRRKVKAACGLLPAPAASAPARKEGGSSRQHNNWQSKPAGPRPKLIDPATLAGNVFVGAFRGKGFKPPPKARNAARKTATAAAASAGSGQEEADQQQQQMEEEEEEEEEAEEQEEQGEEERQDGVEEQQEGDQQADAAVEEAADPEQEQAASPAEAAAPEQQQQQPGGVLLWPGAQPAAAPAPAQPQRYVLVKADTLEEPTDSVLRSARRALGEPSDSKAPTAMTEDEHAAPASVARSKPAPAAAELAPVAEEEEAAVDAEAGADATVAPAEPAAAQALPGAAVLAAMAKQLLKADDNKAKALLLKASSDAVRAAILERLESMDAGRAAACRALLAPAPAADEDIRPAATGPEEAAAPVQQEGKAAQQEQQQEGVAEAEAEAATSARRGRASRNAAAAAGARLAAKRAASAELSDDATETEPSEASSEEEPMEDGSSSDDDDFAAPRPSTRRTRKAPAEEAPQPRRARPSRAAKKAAAAHLAAYAVGVEDGSDAEMAEAAAAAAASSDEEEAPPASQRKRQPARRAAARGKQAAAAAAAASPVPSAAAAAGEDKAAGSSRKVPARKKQKTESGAAAAAAAGNDAMAVDAPAAAADEQATSQQPSSNANAAEQQQQQRSSWRGSPEGAEASDGSGDGNGAGGAGGAKLPRVRAISSTGHTCRGRVKQKSHKSADLVEAGSLRAEKGWYNAGYIFPEGFQSRTLFRSSVAIDQLCVHECYIIGKGGEFWPQPTFKVVALDRPDEPLIAKSCTGCWTGILKRINAEIEARRKAGEDLPPPPKTAIAGPEYFGLNQPNIQEAVEALDPDHLCTEYWAGKQDRQRAAAGLPVTAAAAAPRAPRAPRPPSSSSRRAASGGSKGRSRRRGSSDSEDDEGHGEGEEDETQFMTNKWSAVSRADRYRKRLQDNGEDTSVLDEDNPLPHFIDPITMSAVVRPAISPYGYVAGLATWKVVLAEKQQCPFTNRPLQFEQLKVLTKTNIHLWKDKIVNGSVA